MLDSPRLTLFRPVKIQGDTVRPFPSSYVYPMKPTIIQRITISLISFVAVAHTPRYTWHIVLPHTSRPFHLEHTSRHKR